MKSVQQKELSPRICIHCGLPIPVALINAEDGESERFCCAGCRAVYSIIHGLGLEEYYRYKNLDTLEPRQASRPSGSNYSYFDDSEFQKRYVQVQGETVSRVIFFLQGIHCAACVWLLERLPHVVAGVALARVNFSSGTILVQFDPAQISLGKLASTLDSLGYPPTPIADAGDSAEAQRKDRKALLIRLAVAGMSAGNTMMLAVSLYQGWFSGIASKHAMFLMWSSCILATPAVFYSALPFYRAALAGIRARIPHIDLPISIGILVGFFASILNTLQGSLHVYYDSISMLIFLLLLGRWLQRSSVDRALTNTELYYTLAPRSARVRRDNEQVEVFVGSLLPGDVISVEAGETVCADGKLQTSEGTIDRSVLTGESRPISCKRGDTIWAGSINLGSNLEILVESVEHQTRLGSLLKELEYANLEKPKLVEMTDRISAYFVLVVLGLAGLTWIYWYIALGFSAALETSLALLVVSCPCALGLAAPISLGISLRRAADNRIFIKEPSTIERLGRVTCVALDKTGTLTSGAPRVVKTIAKDPLESNRMARVAAAIEQGVVHPVANAIIENGSAFEQSEDGFAQRIAERRRIPGKGVEVREASNVVWRLGSVSWVREHGAHFEQNLLESVSEGMRNFQSPVVLTRDASVEAVFFLADALRPEAKSLIAYLTRKPYEIALLSGDYREIVQETARKLGIPTMNAFGELEPEAKVSAIKQLSKRHETLMLGDGANDAGALSTANVGVAICGGVEASLRSADVFFGSPNLSMLQALLDGAQKTLFVIKRNLGFSLLYNVTGAALACTGNITPLMAAILMPLSSLTVVASSLFLFRGSFKATVTNAHPHEV